MKNKHLITLIGPTAIGKTALSIVLANHFKTDILSCDSRQFYKEMSIGTAVPSKTELKAAPHHFIQNRSIQEDYSVGAFEKDAIHLLNELFQQKENLILTGGSGLYVDAVIKGLDDFPTIDKAIRETLKTRLELEGIVPLQQQLQEVDPFSFDRIDINNRQRLIRALEISIGSGKPYSYYLGIHAKKRNFKSIKIGLTAEREIVYDRINRRVDLMMEHGLLSEAENLYAFRELNALQTVGYKELFTYFDGDVSLDFAIEEIKKNTRRFAKRQGTWFRRDPEIKWFDFQTEPTEIIAYIETIIAQGG
ncbi:tRNA (adenosine(37)-N6)-dimethylallyltransferase MiaA [Lutimonas sp.]|uniref:tRNA (adenosine(37)-N6)-dimethylallyltransferase MiaA n=1 Tax=Lutimonas sp. TaxID=1872403 RepID=UPI003D9AC7C0